MRPLTNSSSVPSRLLHDQEEWLSANRADIGAKIAEGYASAQRGELSEGDQARARMEDKKRAWRLDKPKA